MQEDVDAVVDLTIVMLGQQYVQKTIETRGNVLQLNIQPSSSKAEQRAEGIKRRKLEVSSTAVPRSGPCNRCSAHGVYDPERLHSSSRSSLCLLYKLDINEYLTNQLGSLPQHYVRKAGMNFMFAENLSNHTCTTFSTTVTEVVDYITELTIKSQVFAAHFILNLLANSPPAPDREINNPIFLASPFSMLYSHISADIANTQATTFTNSVSETFQHRATQFFKFRLRELSQNAISNDNAKKLSLYIYSMKARDRNVFWPRSVTHSHETDAIVQQILDETDFGDPTPVTLATLSESPQECLPFLYHILQQLEDYNEDQLNLADDVQTEASRRWEDVEEEE
ncbi:hypothetical protein G6F56_010452 [Rhizopus delemar]|nr:hypothetical protein G6F56_010452 [Rhizopus delemar]